MTGEGDRAALSGQIKLCRTALIRRALRDTFSRKREKEAPRLSTMTTFALWITPASSANVLAKRDCTIGPLTYGFDLNAALDRLVNAIELLAIRLKAAESEISQLKTK